MSPLRLLAFALLPLCFSCGDDSSGGTGDTGTSPPCATDSALGLARCVEGNRYQEDLVFIAQERTPGNAHWQAVQDLCAARFYALGFTVERHDYGTGVNIVGVKEGTSEPASRVLVAAHYDHIPSCAGADDNATGVAATLEVARVLAMRDFPRTLVVACWDEEELGLIGSTAYAERATTASEEILAYYNFEMIGFVDESPGAQSFPAGFELLFPEAARAVDAREGRGDFLAVIADETASEPVSLLERHGMSLGLPVISIVVPTSLVSNPAIGDLRRSDHAPFWDRGYPAMMLTDTSEFRYDAYHCTSGPDSVDALNQDFSTRVVQTTVAAAAESLGL